MKNDVLLHQRIQIMSLQWMIIIWAMFFTLFAVRC